MKESDNVNHPAHSDFDALVKHGYARGEVFESRARVYTITKAGDARATSAFGGLS